MTFAITNTSATQSTLTQSGTDTTWAGIETAVNAIPVVARATAYNVGNLVRPTVATGYLYRCTVAGTSMAAEPQFGTTAGGITTDGTASFFAFVAPVITSNGDGKVYHCPSYDFVINGTLTISNPMIQTATCRTWTTGAAAVYTSGTFMLDGFTPKFDGVHFTTAMKGANDFSEVSTWAGTWNVRGGTISLAASIRPDSTLPQIFTTVTFNSSALWARSIRFRAYSTALEMRNECRFYNIAYDAFRVPPVLSAKGFASEYVSEYVGSSSGGGTDAKMTVFALSNQDGYAFDFDNYGGGFIEIYNCAKGAALLIVSLNNDARHCVPLFQQLNFKVTNLSGAARDGVRFTCTDAPTNSPTALITTASNLKTWDFRTPLTYTGVTAGGGLASSVPVIQVWHGTTNIKNLRFPASTAVYRLAGYNVIQQDVSVVLGSDTPQTIAVAMTAATNLTLTQAQAAALTGIALVASGATGGTVTVTAARTLSQLWQYFRAWKPDNLASDDSWTFDGVTLSVGAWSVIGLENITGGELVASTSSAAGPISSLQIVGNVTQPTPTNLTNVSITGTLTYNTAAATPVTFTNVTAGTVTNSGAGLVTVKRVNSTLTPGANVTAFVPTTLVFTLNGGRIRVLNNVGAEQFNQTVDGTFELPAAATGTWTYAIRKYGQQAITGSVTIDGTTKAITAAYIPDTQVVDTEANVSAYTDLNSTQRIYDALSLYGATAVGIVFGVVASKGFGTLTVPAGLTLDPAAVAVIAIASGVVTAKSSGLAESATIISSGNFTQGAATLSDGVLVRALNLDGDLRYTVNSLTFYPSQANRDAGTLPGQTLTGGLYRFKLGATVAGVVESGQVFLRVTSGTLVSFGDVTLAAGSNVLDLGVQTQIAQLAAKTLDTQGVRVAVWDAVKANHTIVGSTGTALGTGGGGGTGGATLAEIEGSTVIAKQATAAATLSAVQALPVPPTTAQIWTNATRTLTASLDPTAAQVATQVRAELTTELARIDVSTSTRLATAGYTPPTAAPTATDNAAAVRTNLAAELARVDVATSTRLATAGYTAPNNAAISSTLSAVQALPVAPSAAVVATAVRIELTTELARVDAPVTSRLPTSGYTAPNNAGIASIQAAIAAQPAAPTSAQNAAAVTAALQLSTIPVDIKKVNGITVVGSGTVLDSWGPQP